MGRWAIQFLSIFILFLGTAAGLAGDISIELSRIKRSKVKYLNQRDLSAFPIPVFALRREGLASGLDEITEIKEKIVYPLINESSNPIASIVVEFFPGQRKYIGVCVYWSNGEVRESELSSLRSQLE